MSYQAAIDLRKSRVTLILSHPLKRFNDLPSYLLRTPPATAAEVTFRPAHLADMKALHDTCYPERPLAQFGDSFKRSLEAQRAGQRLHLLAVAPRLPIASGQLVAYSNSVEIADLAVAAAHRGKGLGTALITVLSRVAVFAGYDAAEISVMKGNSRALALYRRLGFFVDRQFSLTDSASVLVLRKPLPADLIDQLAKEAGDDD